MELTFIPFDKEHYQSVSNELLKRPTECSESHFLYHIIWKDFYETKICQIPTGYLWLQKIDHERIGALTPVSDATNLKNNFHILQDYFTEVLHKKLAVYLVDEEALRIISPDQNKYHIYEDIDSSDYIYDAEKLRNLSGKKYHKKKNHLNAFLKEYKDRFEYKQLSLDNEQEILDLTNEWIQSKPGDDMLSRMKFEELGIKNILTSFSSVNMDVKMAGIYIDNKLEAFTIGTYDSFNKMVVIHIEKANDKLRGLYPFINQQFLIHAYPEAAYVNREDDMGLPSLRKAKESYHPLKKTKKYTIIEK